MYKSFFGLRENPFNANPDPRYLFLTREIQEALADVYEHALDSAAAEALGGEHTATSLGVLVDRERVLAQAYETIIAAQG